MQFLEKCDPYAASITLLQLAGENIHYTTRKMIIYRVVNCTVLIFILASTFANLFYVKNELYINTFESLVTIIHVLLKYLLYMYFKEDIGKIFLERLRKYWNYRHFDKNLVEIIEEVYAKLKIFQIVLLSVSALLGYAYLLKSLFNENVFLFDYNTVYESFVLEIMILTGQFYYIYLGGRILLSYDLFYLLFCYDLIMQVKLLKSKLINALPAKSMFKDIADCIEHHIYLSSVLARMQRIYSVMLFFHYFITLVTLCTDLYQLLIGDTSLNNIIVKGLVIPFVFAQFGYYTFPAAQVSMEFSEISYAAYNSNWYESALAIQKQILLIIIKSQRPQYFSGAGLIDINVDAFASVARKSFSFFTILRNLLK